MTSLPIYAMEVSRPMQSDWHADRRSLRRRRRHREPERELTPHEQALKEADAAAQKRVSFFGHTIVWGMCVLFFVVTAGVFPAMIIALLWGIFLARSGYNAVIAPDLKRRYLEEEMQLRLPQQVLRERQLAEGEHARSLERLSAGIAHEIRNPITAAKSLVQQIGEDPSDPDNGEYARVAIEELNRVEHSIAHLLRYAREEPVKSEQTVLADVVESAMDTFKDRLARQSVRVDQQVAGDTRLDGDPDKLRRVVINLVSNALDAMEDAPDAKLTVAAGQNLAGTEVWLQIKDNGMGMSRDKIEKIFSPFHTSKAHGTGLGLAITRKLVELHGGRIEVNSEEGVGTAFIVTLPRQVGLEERV